MKQFQSVLIVFAVLTAAFLMPANARAQSGSSGLQYNTNTALLEMAATWNYSGSYNWYPVKFYCVINWYYSRTQFEQANPYFTQTFTAQADSWSFGSGQVFGLRSQTLSDGVFYSITVTPHVSGTTYIYGQGVVPVTWYAPTKNIQVDKTYPFD